MNKFKATLAILTISLCGQSTVFAATQIKIATLAPQNSQWATDFTAGADEIKSRTDGRVTLKFYWGGAQGQKPRSCKK